MAENNVNMGVLESKMKEVVSDADQLMNSYDLLGEFDEMIQKNGAECVKRRMFIFSIITAVLFILVLFGIGVPWFYLAYIPIAIMDFLSVSNAITAHDEKKAGLESALSGFKVLIAICNIIATIAAIVAIFVPPAIPVVLVAAGLPILALYLSLKKYQVKLESLSSGKMGGRHSKLNIIGSGMTRKLAVTWDDAEVGDNCGSVEDDDVNND